MAGGIVRAADAAARRGALMLLRGYQLLLGGFFAGSCRFYPTCSEYAKTAFSRFSFFRACRLVLWRLLRCHPFCPGGCDLPPEK